MRGGGGPSAAALKASSVAKAASLALPGTAPVAPVSPPVVAGKVCADGGPAASAETGVIMGTLSGAARSILLCMPYDALQEDRV